jgi:hypothetical protein
MKISFRLEERAGSAKGSLFDSTAVIRRPILADAAQTRFFRPYERRIDQVFTEEPDL